MREREYMSKVAVMVDWRDILRVRVRVRVRATFDLDDNFVRPKLRGTR